MYTPLINCTAAQWGLVMRKMQQKLKDIRSVVEMVPEMMS